MTTVLLRHIADDANSTEQEVCIKFTLFYNFPSTKMCTPFAQSESGKC